MEGKYSLLHNLPCPHIHELKNHAYVSIIDIVKDLLAHGLPVDQFLEDKDPPKNVVRILHSLHALEIYKNALKRFPHGNVLPLWIIEWSDDFDPNDSVKNNRGSIWLKTVTISVPHGTEANVHLPTSHWSKRCFT